MLGLNDLFGESKLVNGIGEVYPVKLNQYENFMQTAQILQFTKNHFNDDVQDFSLFELVVTELIKKNELEIFITMLQYVTNKNWSFRYNENDSYTFSSGNRFLDYNNYDQFRDTVMKQNLLYEDKVFKNPMLKKWADKVLEARSKNSVDMSLEDIVGVVHIYTGVPYEKISKYTLYQLKYTFERVVKMVNHRDTVILAPYREDGEIEPFMDSIKLYKHPYDDVFVDKGKLDKLNSAIGAK